METSLKPILFFLILCCFVCCNTSPNKTSFKALLSSYTDTLRSKTNKVIISFYLDFYNSEMQITSNPITQPTELDSIFHFIEGIKEDSCTLHTNIKPDGIISFYKSDSLVGDFIFVLSNNCDGLYSDFTQKPNKYILSNSGKQNLSNLKKQIFGAHKNNR